MDPRIIESQKHRDVLAAFWARKVSRHLTALMVKTPITPNQTTILWGVISLLNSYVVYRVMMGEYFLLPIVPLVYVLTYVLDCVDGEIARVRQMANPVGGKLLDGISHRMTEYSLLVAYASAAAHLSHSPWALPIGLLLVSGEAMYTYAYERRLTTLRVDLGFTGLLAESDEGMYRRDERWRDFSFRRKVATIRGQVHYKSVYAVVALSYVSGAALLVGIALLTVYKHFLWIRLIARTLAATRKDLARKAAEPMPAMASAVPESAAPR
jgi:phosphatidylglycerophosphate synthase